MKKPSTNLLPCLLLGCLAFSGSCRSSGEHGNAPARPNLVIIFCDDLGYGDLGVFGHPTIRTPNLDSMAASGQKWTSFYVAAPVCTPSRAALLTGRLPVRSGMSSKEHRVLFPDSTGGLPAEEITIAEALRPAGYSSACIGKWHLGHHPQFLPRRHGFDYYYGLPYSNDMDFRFAGPEARAHFANPVPESWNVPLIRNEEIIERPANQHTLTQRYTEEAIRFIETHQEAPFFLYLAHTMPHVPLFRSETFRGKSLRGIYGDVIEEIDWSVGQILDTLSRLNLEARTLVVFTSDNGPWLRFREHGGSAGLLRGGKGGTFEGGMRVPAVFWWPGTVQPGVVGEIGTTLDLLPTLLALAGVETPADRPLDGYDLTPVLKGTGSSRRQTVFYYRGPELFAVRDGVYKAHFVTQPEYGGEEPTRHDPPLLYHLGQDPSEQFDIASQHPEIIERIRHIRSEHQAGIEPGPDQLAERLALDP